MTNADDLLIAVLHYSKKKKCKQFTTDHEQLQTIFDAHNDSRRTFSEEMR